MTGLPTGTLMSVNKTDELHATVKNSKNNENPCKANIMYWWANIRLTRRYTASESKSVPQERIYVVLTGKFTEKILHF